MFYPMVKIKTLVGSLLVLLVLGSVYAWSLFNLPLSSKYELDIDAIAFTFGIMTLFIAIGSSSSGFLKLRIGMQNVVALSAVCTGAGLLLSAFAPNLITLYLSAGLLLGFGDGLGYMLVLTNCVKFFPKHKGLVSALCIGAYGLGSLLFKSIDSYVMANYSLENALLTWGAICAVVVTLGSILIYDAMQQASVVSGASSKREYDLQNAIRTLPYWLLSLMFFIDCMVGLYIIGVASNLGSALLNMSAAEAATAVSVVALANIAGRLVMGVLSDRLPRIRLITFDQCLSLVAIILLTVIPITQVTFFAAVALIAFSFGGTLTIYPSHPQLSQELRPALLRLWLRLPLWLRRRLYLRLLHRNLHHDGRPADRRDRRLALSTLASRVSRKPQGAGAHPKDQKRRGSRERRQCRLPKGLRGLSPRVRPKA